MFPIVFNINDHKRCIFTIFFSSSEEHMYLLNSSVMKRINSDGPKFHQYQQSEQSSITSNYGTYKKAHSERLGEFRSYIFVAWNRFKEVARLNRFMRSKSPSSYLDLQLQYRHTNILVK